MEKSFLKWAGGKYKVLPILLPILDNMTDSKIKNQTLIEPFVGSGTVFLNFNKVQSFMLNDKNKILIKMYEELKINTNEFISNCENWFVSENNNKQKYVKIVEEFNQANLQKQAEMFVYLNKHCFNGLMRFNNSGKFNTPFGNYKKDPSFPKKEMLYMGKKIKENEVVFFNVDYKVLLEQADFGDIVYCDPPYLDTFSQYGKGGFTYEDHCELSVLAYQAAIRGAKVVISNSYSKDTRKLYKEASYLEVFDVHRSISSNINGRGNVKELIAVYDF